MKNFAKNIMILTFAVLNILTLSAGDSKQQLQKVDQPSLENSENVIKRNYGDVYYDESTKKEPSSNSIDCETECFTVIDNGELDLGNIYSGIQQNFTSNNFIRFEIHSCERKIRIAKVFDVKFPYFIVGNNDNVTSVWFHGSNINCTSAFNQNSVNVNIPQSNYVHNYYNAYYVYYVMVKITAVKAPVSAHMGLHYATPSISVSKN